MHVSLQVAIHQHPTFVTAASSNMHMPVQLAPHQLTSPVTLARMHMLLQVATDTRLWLLNKLIEVRASLADLIRASVARAEQDVDVLMPGFTHLQPAMTVRWSHWLLAHAASWQRDDMRLRDLMPRVAMLPLGSGQSHHPSTVAQTLS